MLPNNFGGLPKEFSDYKNSKVVIIPIPYEGTVTWLKGTAKAPQAIIEASKNLELYDEELDLSPYEIGICTLTEFLKKINPNDKPKRVIKIVKEVIKNIIKDNKFPIVIGGEHSISYGFYLGLKEKFDNLAVIQFDAHADLRQIYNNSKYNHACVMARIRETAEAIQIGIRSLSEEEAFEIKMKNYKIFWAKDFYCKNLNSDIIKEVKRFRNLFITIDIDVFDPSLVHTGTPEPGGLNWYQLTQLLREICETNKVVGFDVVETISNNLSSNSDFLVARLIYKLIGYIFRNTLMHY